MCGIIGITGAGAVVPRLVDSLKRLEYRGYDSAGIAGVTAGDYDRLLDSRVSAGKALKVIETLADGPNSGLDKLALAEDPGGGPIQAFLAEQYAKSEKDHNQAYDKMIALRDKASPTGKMGTGWDTANAALFLASDQSAYVNGHLLVVDGGSSED